MSRRVAKALLRKAAPINKEYGVGDLVCFKTEQSGWSTASRVIGFEGPKIVWLIHQELPVCVALDRLRPVNASEALAYQHLKDEKGLGAISGRKIGFIDAREPLEMIEEEGEDDYPPPTPIQEDEDEDGIVRNEEEDSAQQNIERRRSIAGTVDEPDEEMIPSRRRSRNDFLDDVPIAIRRRLSSGSVRSESRASAEHEEETSRPAESRAEPSPSAEAMNRAGTTGSGVDLAQEGWNRSHFANDTWQYLPEHGLLIRKHETPRTALFCPDSVSILLKWNTEMALDHGGFKRKHDTWDEGSCENMDSEWTGKTIFVVKSAVTKQVKTKEQTHAFLAERSMVDLSKSGKKKATGKQFNYEKEDETTRKGIDEARRAEWLKWEKFMAVRPIEGEGLQQLLREGYTPIGTQWIDTDKHLHLKRPGVTHKPEYKSRSVALGNQETTLGIRTGSPTADLDSVNMILSWASSEKLRLMALDITNAYFHGETMDRLMILKPPRGGIPIAGYNPDRMYVCRTPIYGSRDSGRLFWKRLRKESIAAGLTASKLSSALFTSQEMESQKL